MPAFDLPTSKVEDVPKQATNRRAEDVQDAKRALIHDNRPFDAIENLARPDPVAEVRTTAP